MSEGRVGFGWSGGMDGKPGAGPPATDRDLQLVASRVAALRELASDAEAAQDGATVYDFSVVWGTLMSGRLRRLKHYHEAGKLTDDQERRYEELGRELEAATPQIERLGLARPALSPED